MPLGAPDDQLLPSASDADLGQAHGEGIQLSRRSFLGLALGSAFTLGSGSSAFAGVLAGLPERRIRLRNVHTGDSFDGVYWRGGKYQQAALSRLSWVLRDFRAGEVKAFDPHLFDLLGTVAQRMGSNEPFEVVSGYRTRATNSAKRRGNSDVARNSYHVRAQAIDIYLPGRSVRGIHHVAVKMAAGGVGFYPQSGFVHLDTGPVRTW